MIDDQTLTLYYFRDGLDDDERQAVKQALRSDDVLAARYQALAADLESLASPAAVPAPEHLKHQWHDLVGREARLERQRSAPAPEKGIRRPWLGLGAAFTSVMALGVAIGLWLPDNGPGPQTTPAIATTSHAPATTTTPGPATGPDVTATPRLASFERGLQLHLRESSNELASLDHRDNADRDALLAQIIAQNRLFERAAVKQQAPDIARVMRAIEPILLRLADADTTPEDAEALRRQLTFELNAVLTRLQQPASKATTI